MHGIQDCRFLEDRQSSSGKVNEDELRGAGITLWLAALNPEPLCVIQRAPLGTTLGYERLFFNLEPGG
jgi:hypothetical protein